MPSEPAPDSASDPFTLLGLPRSFEVDQAALQRAWLSGTARLHPDRPDAPPDAASLLAAMNRAKKTLEDPENRANALLTLLGGPSKEQDRSLPDGFLVEMMETREKMEGEIVSEGDAARRRWDEWAAARRAEHLAAVRTLFNRAHRPDPETLGLIRRELNAWRYIERMIEQLDPAYTPGRGND